MRTGVESLVQPRNQALATPRLAQTTAYILSCPEREELRNQTVANLRATDWDSDPEIEIDQTTCERRQERQERTALRLLERAVADGPGFILFLEDDLIFNRHLKHNLHHWVPLIGAPPERHFFASIYNPTVRPLSLNPQYSFFVADPNTVYGSQAFLLSLATARYITEHWSEVIGMQDTKMSRLAARVSTIYYHTPSLVQHVGVKSAWGGGFHSANDFSADWEAPELRSPLPCLPIRR
jgi:hypothetical protein